MVDKLMTASERIAWEKENLPFVELAKRQGQYMVVASPDMVQMITMVNKQLAEGWDVAGGIAQAPMMRPGMQGALSVFMQALVRKDK